MKEVKEMATRRQRQAGLTVVVVALSSTAVLGQWKDQVINLQPGWNPVYLEVQPEDNVADNVFVTSPPDAIDRVWTWRATDAGIGIACSDPTLPECQPTPTSGWDQWLPPSDPNASIVNDLYTVRSGQVYIFVCNAAATLTIRGKPDTSKTRWVTGFNIAGFHVDDANPPTFDTYLSPSSAHSDTRIYQMNPDGTLSEVLNTDVDTITPQTGYWVRANTNADYDGPIDINPGAARGLNYGSQIAELLLQFENLADASRTVTVDVAASLTPPTVPADLPTDAGVIPLKYRDYETNPDALFIRQDLNESTSASFSVDGADAVQGASRIVRLSVDRQGQSVAEVDPETGSGSEYQSIVTINDGAGFERSVAVTAQVPNRAGLYTGTVSVNHVAWVQAAARIVSDPDEENGYEGATFVSNPDSGSTTEPRPTINPFVFPVLVHFDGNSNYTFLTEATLLFKPPVGNALGKFVLATPDCDSAACDDLVAGSIIDGERFSLQFATAAFAFDDDLALTGDFGTSLVGETIMPADHRLNPFRHRYHPDHDGDNPGESFAVKRTFGFSFDCSPPGMSGDLSFACGATAESLDTPGQGDVFLRGCYYETLSGDGGNAGLHKDAINVCGTFNLRRISTIPALNDLN